MIKKDLKKLHIVKPKPIYPYWTQAELMSRIQEVATQMSNTTRRGNSGNWVVVGSDVANILNGIQQIHDSIDYTNCWSGCTFTHSAHIRTITYSVATQTII